MMKMQYSPSTAISQSDQADAGIDVFDQACEGNAVTLVFRPVKIARVHAALVAVILFVGTVANVVIYHVAPSPEHGLAKVMQRFDLGHEPSLPAWYSSLALVACSGLLCLIARVKMRRSEPYRYHWAALSVILLLMGLDEAVMIHEMADKTLHDFFGTSGFLYFAWVIPGAMVVLAVGLAYLKFLRHLDARTRWMFILSGVVFVSGAIGMELIAGMIFTYGEGVHSLAHTAEQTVEEGCEMFAIVLFTFALLDYIGRNMSCVVVRVDASRLVASRTAKLDSE